MSNLTKNLLLALSILLFLIIAPLLILYETGYIFNWSALTLEKTGGFYFSSKPTGANIYVNNKSIGSTNTYFNGYLPNLYNVSIQKDGYFAWKKNLYIYPQLVTKANAILVPSSMSYDAYFSSSASISNTFISPNGTEVIYVTGTTSKEIHDLNLNSKKDAVLFTGIIGVKDISFSGSQILVYFQNSSSSNNWMVIDDSSDIVYSLDGYFQTLNIDPNNVDKIVFSPQDSNVLIISEKNANGSDNVYTFNYANFSQSPIVSNATGNLTQVLGNVSTFTASSNNIFYIDSNNILNEASLPDDTKKVIYNLNPYLAGKSAQLSVYNDSILIQNNGNLLLISAKDDKLSEIASGVAGFYVAPDYQKVAVITSKNVFVYYLTKVDSQLNNPFLKQKGNMTLISSSDNLPKSIVWYQDSENMFMIYSNKVEFSDIDDRGALNQYDVLDAPYIDQAWWNNNLFISTNNNIYLYYFNPRQQPLL